MLAQLSKRIPELAYLTGCVALTTWLVWDSKKVADFYGDTFSGNAPVGTSISFPVSFVVLGALALAALGFVALRMQLRDAARRGGRSQSWRTVLFLGAFNLTAIGASGVSYAARSDRGPLGPTWGADVWLAAGGTILGAVAFVLSTIWNARSTE